MPTKPEIIAKKGIAKRVFNSEIHVLPSESDTNDENTQQSYSIYNLGDEPKTWFEICGKQFPYPGFEEILFVTFSLV